MLSCRKGEQSATKHHDVEDEASARDCFRAKAMSALMKRFFLFSGLPSCQAPPGR